MTDSFKVIITVLRDRRTEHDAIVTFTVLPDRRNVFGEILQNYLKELSDARIKVTSADDSETFKPIRLFIEIESYGRQTNAVQRLQQYIAALQPNCSEIT